MTEKKRFYIYKDSIKVLDKMTDIQVAQLFRAIKAYHEGKEPILDDILSIIFIPFENQFERENLEYQKTCEKNRANAQRARSSHSLPVDTYKDKEKDTDTDKDTDKDCLGKIVYGTPTYFKKSVYCSDFVPEDFYSVAEYVRYQGDVETEFFRFKNYWLDRNERRSDWLKSWELWLRNAFKRGVR